MLLLMIERGLPIDLVLTADTGMEFPEMYRHWDRVEQYLFQKRGLKLTILRNPKGFEWLMFNEPKSKRSSLENRALLGVPPYGNGWPSMNVRWCTGHPHQSGGFPHLRHTGRCRPPGHSKGSR